MLTGLGHLHKMLALLFLEPGCILAVKLNLMDFKVFGLSKEVVR